MPKTHGICQFCSDKMVSKCGPKTTWHWAHAPKRNCDPWWENETPWHREWKSRFPEEWRECVHHDPETNEKHIADIKTDSGLIIEFQNSPMSLIELRSREKFYGNMIWIVNGEKFKNRFHVLGPLPDPNSEFAQDIIFFPQRIDHVGRGFWRRSENPGNPSMVEVHSYTKIEDEVWENYNGYHHFHWERPRSVWFDSAKPVYCDFGGDCLYLLRRYDERGLMAVQKWGLGIINSWGALVPEVAK
ncbi:MAG: hypothetical protein HQ582_14235 [Planctomycetes bacterium]|nr:hypothetical protein [Planctomycetota bacterium]